MVIKRDISSTDIADRAEGVLSVLLNRKIKSTELETQITDKSQSNKEHYRLCCGIIYIVFGTISIILGIFTTFYPLTKIILDDRLKMTPGLPAFELWYKPKVEIILRTYIFNVTNSIEFLNGIDKKLKIEEVGPIVYGEILDHSDVVFHKENSTMSYTVTRTTKFLPERNEPGILNKTVIVPNTALLGMAVYLQNYIFTVKMGFNILSRWDSVFLNLTIHDCLWNLTTPALTSADKYLPYMTPTNNTGALYIVYNDFKDRVNINIGKYHGYQDFFKINTFNYVPTVPGFETGQNVCFASLMNSTEGACYGQLVSKTDILYYWRKTACRPIPLYFEHEVTVGKLLGYKYTTRSDMYDRTNNSTTDCYKSFNKIQYPNGLSDASNCFMKLPVAMSLPHFYNRTGYWNNKVEGFKPKKEHLSFAIIEPNTGLPLEQSAKSQSNLVIPNLTGFNSKINKFSNMVLPIVWFEYHLEKLTPYIDFLMYCVANIFPIGQYVISIGILIFGIYILIIGVRRLILVNHLKNTNTNLVYLFDNEIST